MLALPFYVISGIHWKITPYFVQKGRKQNLIINMTTTLDQINNMDKWKHLLIGKKILCMLLPALASDKRASSSHIIFRKKVCAVPLEPEAI